MRIVDIKKVSGSCLIVMVAGGMPAWAQGSPPAWNMYGHHNTILEVEYALGPMSSSNTARINTRFPGFAMGQATLDTGSTGIVVGSDHFRPGPNDIPLGPGSQSYGSSGLSYSGTYYNTAIDIYDKTGKTIVAKSTVRVLSVGDQDKKVFYMGVGFNRGNGAPQPTMIPVSANPFLNITWLKHGKLSELHKGYVIQNDKVTIGIPTTANSEYAFVKLAPNAIDWNVATMSVSVATPGSLAVTGSGTFLPDTGINYMFLSPPLGTDLRDGFYAPVNTDIQISLPGSPAQGASYQFKAVAHDHKDCTIALGVTPCSVTALVKGNPPFVNSGREFYSGFDYIYDFENGYVGYKWVGPAVGDATGNSTPSLALSGAVPLSDKFNSSLPTFLMDATTLQQSGTGTFSGIVSGPGGLTVAGGQVNLTGANTYTGGTTVTGGATLGVNTDAALGDPSAGLTLNGGTLLTTASFTTTSRTITLGSGGGTFDTNGFDLTLGSAVTGPGSLTKNGIGTLTLSGANSYAGGTVVNQGILQLAPGASLPTTGALALNGGTLDLNGNNLTIGSLAGLGGRIELGSSTLTVAGPGSTSFAGTLTGTGGLTMQGPGMLSLTGINTYTGPTNVNGGRLAINGSITSDVTVGAGGNLGGTGTIFGIVTNNGIAAPGNSIGTLNVVGSLTQAAGSSFQVETTAAGQADRVNVSGAPGTATIAGGTVTLTAATGVYAPSTTYTILNATGGVTGTFANANSLFPFLQPSLSYDANNVFLTLKPGGFGAGAGTANQAAVGRVLDASVAGSTGDLATVIGTMATYPLAQGQAAMNAVSGQNYSGFGTANLGGGLLFMNGLGQQMALARGGFGGGTRVALAQACETGLAEACDGAASPWSLWGSALGGTGRVAGTANAGTLTYNAGGFTTGVDYRFDPRFLAGIGVGFSSGNQWASGFSGQGTTSSYQASLYASFVQGAFYLDGMAGYGYSDNWMTRQIALPNLAVRTAQGRTAANQFLGQVEAGYRIGLHEPAALSVTPFARFQGITNSQYGFSESGAGALSLTVAPQTTGSARSVLGAEFAGAFGPEGREKLAVQMRLGWAHEYADTARPVTAAFAGAPGANFTVFGAAPQRDTATLSLAANTAVAQGVSLYARYDGEVGNGISTHALNGGFRVSW